MNEEKKPNRIVKILCVGAGLIAVALLCYFSSRFSWFGVYGDNQDNSSSSAPAPATTAPVSSVTTPQATAPMTSEQTTATTTTTTTTTTATTAAATTTATATTTTKATTTTATTKPAPLWTETECSATMYVTAESCSTRKQGLQGSQVMGYKFYGEAVNVVATTNTGYYKLDNGTYIHSDYLSTTKPPETTTTAATTPAPKPVTTSTTANSDPQPNGVFDNITTQPVNCTEEEAEVFRLVNELRKQNGVKALKWDMNAYIAAKTRCEEIPLNFSHNRNGQDFSTVYPQNIRNLLAYSGENIGGGQETAKQVVDQWMNSELHRKNILNPEFDNLAVAFGTFDDEFYYYWVQEFTTYKKS